MCSEADQQVEQGLAIPIPACARIPVGILSFSGASRRGDS